MGRTIVTIATTASTLARPDVLGPFNIYITDLDATIQIGKLATVYSAIRPIVMSGRVRGCQQGGCGLCQIDILAGTVIPLGPMSKTKLGEGGPGYVPMLACRIVAASDLMIELGARFRNARRAEHADQNT